MENTEQIYLMPEQLKACSKNLGVVIKANEDEVLTNAGK